MALHQICNVTGHGNIEAISLGGGLMCALGVNSDVEEHPALYASEKG